MQGRRVRLLMERPDLGRTEGFAQTRLAGRHDPGAIVDARITGAAGGQLLAEAA
jgi:threonylcarbamoyladenosine tRNA methylthiotransferase MtaB